MKDIEQIVVSRIFEKPVKYIVPTYQRNYAWEDKHVGRLIDDIINAKGEYCLGMLVVDDKDENLFEVVDGQQRLTTLYLIDAYINEVNHRTDSLTYEARQRYKKALEDPENSEVEEIKSRYDYIKSHFGELCSDGKNTGVMPTDDKQIDPTAVYKNHIEKVYLLRVAVPKNIDLNHYFEVMNTRGEQLEPHQIAKAKIIEQLDEKERKLAATIWDCCANMDSYVQRTFDKNDSFKIRWGNWSEVIEQSSWKDQADHWSWLNEVVHTVNPSNQGDKQNNLTLRELLDMGKRCFLKADKKAELKNKNDDDETSKYRSIISFPDFLLQADYVINRQNKKYQESDFSLDDKKLLEVLEKNWQSREKAKEFVVGLLRCRVLFDKYILKRDYSDDEDGKWSLKRAEKQEKDGGSGYEYSYPLTYGSGRDQLTDTIKTLQSALRITITSAQSMSWITEALQYVWEHNGDDSAKGLKDVLENYCRDRIRKLGDYTNSGTDTPHIVFSYLDYLLYRDGFPSDSDKKIIPKQPSWDFQFRTSIEHFFAQHNVTKKPFGGSLDMFGNLALVTVSANSKFSNNPPQTKIGEGFEEIIEQSLKLKIMAKLTKDNGGYWTHDLAKKHLEDMQQILRRDIPDLPKWPYPKVSQGEQKSEQLNEADSSAPGYPNTADAI